MTDEDSETKLKRIQIKTESGSKWFKTGKDFSNWINEQKNIYNFLSGLPNRHNEHGLKNILDKNWQPLITISQSELQGLVNDEDQYANKVDVLVNEFQKRLKNNQVFTIDASFSTYIEDIKDESPERAAAALAYFLNFTLNNWNIDIFKGMQSAIDWERNFSGRVEHEENSLNSLKSSWDDEFNELNNNARAIVDRIDHLNKRGDQLISAQKKRFGSDIENYEEQLNKELEKANVELENITRTYDENLALHASVRYWGLQEKYHKRMSIGFGILTTLVALLVLWGIYEYADRFLNAGIEQLQISRLLTAVIITTFGIWAVRTCSTLFMSHTHLRTEAQERRTMLHTYLALLRRGQGPGAEERQLILQTLFRPSSTGMIKEDAGPNDFFDLLGKIKSIK